MTGRRRTMLLALLAVAVPLPALAASEGSLTTSSPVALSVSTSLGSCGLSGSEIICRLNVSYNTLPGATSYSATVTRADGSVVDYGEVGAGGATLSVPYVGSGSYSVRITAYGEPEEPAGEKPVISTEISAAQAEGKGGGDRAAADDPDAVGTEAGPRGTPGETTVESDGAVETEPACSPATPAPVPVEPEPLPEPPPADLDPKNADEDADGVPDAQERTEYDAAVAAQADAAAGAEAPAAATDCP